MSIPIRRQVQSVPEFSGLGARRLPPAPEKPSSMPRTEAPNHPHFNERCIIEEVSLSLSAGQALYRRPASPVPVTSKFPEQSSTMATFDSNVLKLAPDAGAPVYRTAPHN